MLLLVLHVGRSPTGFVPKIVRMKRDGTSNGTNVSASVGYDSDGNGGIKRGTTEFKTPKEFGRNSMEEGNWND